MLLGGNPTSLMTALILLVINIDSHPKKIVARLADDKIAYAIHLAKKRHGDKYDYSKVKGNSKHQVITWCFEFMSLNKTLVIIFRATAVRNALT